MIHIYGGFIKETGKCLYIGTTEQDFINRWFQHQRALKKGVHTNKSLQKSYNQIKENGLNMEWRQLKSFDCDSTLIKFFLEGLYNSLYKPSCNKIVISQGRNNVILSRCDKDLAEKLIQVF
ncbi:hypothetical protein [Clostridium sp.]|uniref:hypothetical protein n=1 Tax=Clostridium sp. TaxID=1506 RepID=UPI00261F7A4A|nr:hypothetical protein [Clostridium sp.]